MWNKAFGSQASATLQIHFNEEQNTVCVCVYILNIYTNMQTYTHTK